VAPQGDGGGQAGDLLGVPPKIFTKPFTKKLK